MKKNYLTLLRKGVVLLLPLASLLSVSCGISPEEPEKVTATGEIENELSKIDIPIIYQTWKLEQLINKKIQGVIFENDFKEDAKDQVKITVTKIGDIKLQVKGDKMYYRFPLNVRCFFQKNVLLFKVKNKNEIDFSLVLDLASSFHIDQNWKLVTKTSFTGLQWKEKPSLKVAGLTLNLANFVEKKLEDEMPKILEKVDETVHNELNLRGEIEKIWGDIQKPILINKKQKKVWLKADPVDLIASPIRGNRGNLEVLLRLHSYLYTLIGNDIDIGQTTREPLPSFRQKAIDDEGFSMFIKSKIAYKDVAELLTQNLKGKEIDVEGQKIKLAKIDVFGSGDDLVVMLKVKGDLKGQVFLRGKPTYDSALVALKLDNFDFDLKTEELLLSTADWLLHDTFKDEIQKYLVFPLKEQILKLPELVQGGIKKGKTGEKINVSLSDIVLTPQELLVTDENFQLVVLATGKASLELKQIQ